MTLVTNDENTLPMMLGLQQQQQQQQHHHHHNIGGNHAASPMNSSNMNTNIQNHNRGNVIVTTANHQSSSDLKMTSCKRTKMYQTTPYSTVPHQPASVARRNARERNRVKQVNNGFATLRQHIPQSVAQALGSSTAGTHGGSRAGSKKLSKVETLKMAVEYIRSLQSMLDDSEGSTDLTNSSMSSVSTSPSTSPSPLSSTCGSTSLIDMNTSELHSVHSQDIHLQQQNIIYDKHSLRQNQNTSSFVPPPSSEASSSPTPSFVSETSSAGSQGFGGSTSTVLFTPHQDVYENYEPMSPEDEELLDVISWWQQSQ